MINVNIVFKFNGIVSYKLSEIQLTTINMYLYYIKGKWLRKREREVKGLLYSKGWEGVGGGLVPPL